MMPPRRFRLLLVFGLLAVGATALARSQWRILPRQVSGLVEADEIRVGSRVGGRVRTVQVSEGESVSKGTVLLTLEPYDLEKRLAEADARRQAAAASFDLIEAGARAEEVEAAQARVDQAQFQLDEAMAGPRPQEIRELEDNLKLAQAELDLAEQTLARTETLYTQRLAAKEDFDKATRQLRVARSNVDVQRSRLDVAKEGTRSERKALAKATLMEAKARLSLLKAGSRSEEKAEAKAQLAAATAAHEAFKAQMAELEVRAPLDSTVEAVELQPGDLIAPNAPVVSLMDVGHLWVRAYVPETLLGLARPGRIVPIRVDGFAGQWFRGRIGYVSRHAEFVPGNVQTPEERSKQVFRIKVDLEEGLDLLRPGMEADVLLDEELGSEGSTTSPTRTGASR